MGITATISNFNRLARECCTRCCARCCLSCARHRTLSTRWMWTRSICCDSDGRLGPGSGGKVGADIAPEQDDQRPDGERGRDRKAVVQGQREERKCRRGNGQAVTATGPLPPPSADNHPVPDDREYAGRQRG